MAAIRAKDTTPERIVRRTLFALGYRFRLHVRDLPGSPDIVLPRHRTIVFVHGCFWHRHARCRYAYTPKTRPSFWLGKFSENMKRDSVARQKLRRDGWKVLVIWECQTRDPRLLAARLNRLLVPKPRKLLGKKR